MQVHNRGVLGLRDLVPQYAKLAMHHGKILGGIATIENGRAELNELVYVPAANILEDEPVNGHAHCRLLLLQPTVTLLVSPDDAEKLDPGGKPIAVITQTTLSLDDVASTVDALATRFGDLRRPDADDICYATQNRQDAVKEMVAQGATLILVIGSETSSNAQRLVEVARLQRAAATLIDGERDLDRGLLDGHTTIGLTAGASTPEELVQAVVARLAAVGYDDLAEIEVAREDVHFRLPREVVAS